MSSAVAPSGREENSTVKASDSLSQNDRPETKAPVYEHSTDWNLEHQAPATGTNKRRFRLACLPTTFLWTVSDKFDRVVPPHKRILGLSRKIFCLIVLVVFLCLLGLIIGLAVGLTKNHKERPADPTGDTISGGELTYYDPGLGACGIVSTSKDAIVSISHFRFDEVGTPNPNNNPLCNKKIRINRGDASVDVTVVDRCVGCKRNDLDVSLAVFEKLASEAEGRVQMLSWSWL